MDMERQNSSKMTSGTVFYESKYSWVYHLLWFLFVLAISLSFIDNPTSAFDWLLALLFGALLAWHLFVLLKPKKPLVTLFDHHLVVHFQVLTPEVELAYTDIVGMEIGKWRYSVQTVRSKDNVSISRLLMDLKTWNELVEAVSVLKFPVRVDQLGEKRV